MTVAFVAVHYPQPDHFEEFVGRTHRVGEALRSRPDCEGAEIWVTLDETAVVTMGRFDSHEAFERAFGDLRKMGDVVGFDARERKPRDIFTLEPR